MRRARDERTARIGKVALAAAMTGGLVSGAQAQTVNVNTPVSVPVAGNVDRFRVVPVITSVYDSNVLRLNDARGSGPRDNIRVSPALAVDLNRIFGRTRVTAGGTVGYDFNTRFSGLDRERINLTSSVTTPVGAPCSVTGSAALERAQFDLGDTNTVVTESFLRQVYDVGASCRAAAGFFPAVGVNRVSLTNSSRKVLDTNQSAVRAGIGYGRPSLGTLQLIGSVAKIARPGIEDLTGIDDSTMITDVQLVFERSVAPRVSFRLGGGITHADPKRAAVPSFSGPSFDAQVTIRPVPRFTIVGSGRRAVQNQSSFGATYIIADSYNLNVSYLLSARSTATLFAQRAQRDPRGEDLALTLQPPRGKDKLNLVGGSYAFDFHRSLRLSLSVTHQRRTADNAIYDYTATSASAGVTARF